MIGKYVVVRTHSAGVHIGTLVQQSGTAALLSNARRLWRWSGAVTLHEVAIHGVDRSRWTRISNAVPEILLTEAIEIIPTSNDAKECLDEYVWNSDT